MHLYFPRINLFYKLIFSNVSIIRNLYIFRSHNHDICKMFVTIQQHTSSTIAFPGDIIEQQWIDVVSKALKSGTKKLFSSKTSLWIVCKGFVVKHSFDHSFFFHEFRQMIHSKKERKTEYNRKSQCASDWRIYASML